MSPLARLAAMKKVLFGTVAIRLVATSDVVAAQSADLPWTRPNLKELRASSKGEVAAFINRMETGWMDISARNIGQLDWADLAGDGRYELLITLDVNGRHFYNALEVYTPDSSGRVS